MRTIIQLFSVAAFWIFIILFPSCKKDTLSKYDTAVTNMKIFDDDSIALPVTVTAGDNCLLSSYSTTSGEMKFNLTDNEGNLIWQKQFGVNSISAILKENDGTFSIISGSHIINIDLQGNILKNTHINTYPFSFDNATIFSARINKNNNYLICGVHGIGLNSVNRAFAAEYTHDGDSVFFRRYLDTVTIVNNIGQYSVITGCEETDDGGYVFFGSYYGYSNSFSSHRISFNIVRTNNVGEVIWQYNNLLVDSQNIPQSVFGPPFTDQLPFSTDVYGFHPQSYTHEIVRTADGNYLCFLNMPDYLSSDQRARVYKIGPNGNMLDSVFIDFGTYNRYMGGLANYFKYTNVDKSYSCGNGVVRNADNTFSICMQNGFFGSKGLTTSYIGESKSFMVRIDENLNILNTHYLQNYYSDCFTSNCKSSAGNTVYFGLISSFGKSYKPALIFSNDN